jgi:hypothetical protein
MRGASIAAPRGSGRVVDRTGMTFRSAHKRCGEFVHGGSHRVFDRLHVVDLRRARHPTPAPLENAIGRMGRLMRSVVRRTGLEPARPCGHWLLRPARLPIPPSPLRKKFTMHCCQALADARLAQIRRRRFFLNVYALLEELLCMAQCVVDQPSAVTAEDAEKSFAQSVVETAGD